MKKILLIEDETMLVEMYMQKFEQEGFEMVSAFTAEEGLELAKKEKPDLIILDILLPKESGIFFLKEMKRDSEMSQIPVVALSNYDHPIARREAKNFGAKDYLIKTDYTPKELVEKIKEYLK